MELEDLGEQLYNLLAQVLNRPENRALFIEKRIVSSAVFSKESSSHTSMLCIIIDNVW